MVTIVVMMIDVILSHPRRESTFLGVLGQFKLHPSNGQTATATAAATQEKQANISSCCCGAALEEGKGCGHVLLSLWEAG
eukprot:6490364-Amphidinium_carterae.3